MSPMAASAKTRHTPGPWRLKPFASGYDICIDGVSSEASGGWFIELHSGLNERDSADIHAEFEANAALIIAAPDLLVALHNTLSLLKAFTTAEDAVAAAVWREAEAAIAKAGASA